MEGNTSTDVFVALMLHRILNHRKKEMKWHYNILLVSFFVVDTYKRVVVNVYAFSDLQRMVWLALELSNSATANRKLTPEEQFFLPGINGNKEIKFLFCTAEIIHLLVLASCEFRIEWEQTLEVCKFSV